MKSCYDKNKTMKFLGMQDASAFWLNEKIQRKVQDISEARKFVVTLDVAADIFMLGYIYGKRAERERKAKV